MRAETLNIVDRAITETEKRVEREIAKYLRMTPRAKGVQISINSSQDIARLADDIESGDYKK